MTTREEQLREQHKRRMEHMPHLYFEAGPEIRAWAEAWQAELRAELREQPDPGSIGIRVGAVAKLDG